MTPILESPAINAPGHILCNYFSAIKGFAFFSQICDKNSKLQLFKMATDKQTNKIALTLETHPINCIEEEEVPKVTAVDVHFFDGCFYIVLNTSTGLEVRGIGGKTEAKRFILPNYFCSKSTLLENTLVLFAENWDEEGAQEIVLSNFNNFELMGKFHFRHDASFDVALSQAELITRSGSQWQRLRFVRKNVIYMKMFS